MLQNVVLAIHVMLSVAIIGLVLIQQGKGSEAGAALSGSASNTVFGSQGSGSFLSRLTGTLACFFALTSLGLGLLAAQSQQPKLSDKLNQTPVAPMATEIPELPQDAPQQ